MRLLSSSRINLQPRRRPHPGTLAALAVAALLLLRWQAPTPVAAQQEAQQQSQQAPHPPTPTLANPDQACASCHQQIVARYETTPMARASSVAVTPEFAPGSLLHQASGVQYRIFLRGGKAWMSFDRPAPTLHGERELRYTIGSGRRGRTFLYQIEDEWFQLPINHYRKRDLWDMAPGYDTGASMPDPIPVDANCLHCHASAVAARLPQARNRFAASAPFAQGGIGCSACHGDPSQHLAQAGHGPILNPATLSVPRRDSICLQCHLEGDAVVYRPGRSLSQFRPGENLDDTAVYFVRASQATGGARATSQYEALLHSACKRAVGDALTCTTCHDPHSSPSPETRVAFFRARCLACHSSPALATTHHPEQPDCASCHMPSRPTTNVSHEQVTDHNIERRPSDGTLTSILPPGATEDLVPIGGFTAGDRELGLAYAQLAQQGDRSAGQRALTLLSRAERSGPVDSQVHVNLGFLDQMAGNLTAARSEYLDTLRSDPFDPIALADLAVLDARSGQVAPALQLLDRLLHADPSQIAAGIDLALIQCAVGQPAQARALLNRLQQFSPDSPALRQLLQNRTYAGQACPEIRLHP